MVIRIGDGGLVYWFIPVFPTLSQKKSYEFKAELGYRVALSFGK